MRIRLYMRPRWLFPWDGGHPIMSCWATDQLVFSKDDIEFYMRSNHAFAWEDATDKKPL